MSDLKGLCQSPQAHARIDEKYFEIVGPTSNSNTMEEFRNLFISV